MSGSVLQQPLRPLLAVELRTLRVWLGLLVLLSVCSACKRKEQATQDVPAIQPATNRQVFNVKGLVLALKSAEKQVEIKHEAIPGYMPAMTMPFDVKDTNELSGLEAGDYVSFRLQVSDSEGWIDNIHRLSGPGTNGPPTAGPFRLARDVEPLGPGDLLPEYFFTNQFGQRFSTAQFKSQALAITFLFTRCPYPNFCPRMANQFEQAQEAMLAQTNAPTNWHLLTISFDPDFDTPQVLERYARLHQYDPKHWTFATGTLIDVTAIGEQFGLAFWRDETGSISHNLRTIVIDANGRVQRIFEGNQWTSAELVRELLKAARNK